MKKIKITIILIIVMIMNLTFINNYSRATVNDVQGKLSVTGMAGKVGEKVTAKIVVKSDILLDNDNLLLEFDKTKLKYETSTVATIANAMIMGGNRENHSSGPDGFSIAMTSAIADKVTIPANTELATVTFSILAGTTSNQSLKLVHYKGTTRTELAESTITLKQDIPSTPTPTPVPSKPTPTPTPSKPTSTPTPTPTPSNPTPTPTPSDPEQDNQQPGETEKITYEMLEGKDSIWTYGDKNLIFRSSAEFSTFINITIDGVEVDKENYTAKSGSTVIEVKEKYLKTLSVGTHEISINSQDGSATAKFKVTKKEDNSSSKDETVAPEKELPQTGEETNPFMFILLAGVMLACGVGIVLHYKAKRA